MTEADEQRRERRGDDAEGGDAAAAGTPGAGAAGAPGERPADTSADAPTTGPGTADRPDQRPRPVPAAEPPISHPLPGPRTAWDDTDVIPPPQPLPHPIGPQGEEATRPAEAARAAAGKALDAGPPHPDADRAALAEDDDPDATRLAWPRPRRQDELIPVPPPPAQPAEPAEPPAAPAWLPSAPPPPGTPAAAAASLTPQPDLDDTFFADLAAGALEGDQEARSYRELVRQVDAYIEQRYRLFGLVGYPASGKTHALKALVHRLHGFDASAREQFRRERAPGPTEAWTFYYAFTGSGGERWVFMDAAGELYARMRANDWSRAEATAGLLHTIGHCQGLVLLVHLTRGHLDRGAQGFAAGMDDDEIERERGAQQAQEEIEFFDQFLLFARALAAEKGDVSKLVRRAAEAPSLDEALRGYRQAPRLDVPVAVLFTQADRLMGADFAVGRGRYLAPQRGLVGVAPFVARHLPALFDSVQRHARRFRFDFVQSYVERPSPGGGEPVWSVEGEPLSVGLVPALEFLLRRADRGGGLGRFAIDTRTALRLHRLLHPRLWDGVEAEL